VKIIQKPKSGRVDNCRSTQECSPSQFMPFVSLFPQTDVVDPRQFHRHSPLHAVQWYRLVMDGSHCVKDASAKQTKACIALEASRRWCCSGTHVATDVMDMHGQFAAVRMTPFSDTRVFSSRYKTTLNVCDRGADLLYALSCVMVRHTGVQKTGGGCCRCHHCSAARWR
jgi:hypothetical protein